MGTILNQDGLHLVNPDYIEVSQGGFIFARWRDEELGGVVLGKYRDLDRAKEVLREIFQTEYYEMPIEQGGVRMISKEYNEFKLYCDMCGEYVAGFDSFEDVIAFTRKEDWTTIKTGGNWEDYCPICSEDIY